MVAFRNRIDLGHLLFVLFILACVLWYFIDAYTASSSIQNLILIAPASGLALVLCAVVLFQILRPPKTVTEEDKTGKMETAGGWTRLRTPIFIALFGLYVLTLDVIGFDVATYLFIAAAMLLQGERRPWVVVGYSLGFGTLVVLVFTMLLPYPMLTVVVPGR